MSPRIRRRGYIPIPPDRKTKWSCTIAGTTITNFILDGKFPWGLITEELVCEIELDNSGEDFTGVFSQGDEIIFLMDFTDGTTVQFKGEIEEIKSRVNANGFILGIKGAHWTAKLLDVMVTEEFTSAQISEIRNTLISTYIPSFSSTNVEENITTINIKFVNKPLFDCLIDLDVQGDEDSYIDHDKDLHSFKKNSKENLIPHVTQDDSLLNLRGLGTDSADVRNKITVYGIAGGLPVIATSEDSSSQGSFGTKERIITDNAIVDETQATELSDAENVRLKQPESQGSADTLFMLELKPGDKIYVISNPHKVHDLFRVTKFVFRVPEETMEIFFSNERSVPKLFKDRILKEIGQEDIINKNKMSNSFNFGSETGFNENKIDGSASNDAEVVEGKLKIVGAPESANMISITKETSITVNQVEVRVIGENLNGVTYFINADGTNNWEQVTLNTVADVTIKGTDLRLRIRLTDTTTRISSACILYK